MKPTPEELRKLYVEDGLTTRQIGEIYGVAHISVRRWLAKHGIPVKPPGRGLVRRGINPPTKDDLVRMIHKEFLSYSEIASKYGADSTAVYHWLNKHGIERPKLGVAITKGRTLCVDPEVVRTMYEAGESLDTIGDHYGVSAIVIKAACEKFGIEIRPNNFSQTRCLCDNGLEVRSTYEIRVANWLLGRNIPFCYEPSYPYGSRWRADFEANGWFIEVWGVVGEESYDAKRGSKVRFCSNHGIPLIELFPRHFGTSRGDLLTKPLSKVLFPAKAQGMLF